MPTINLNNTQTTPTTPVTLPTPAPNSTPAPANDWGGWNDPWQDDSTDTINQQNNQKRLTPQERVGMIEKVYLEVLGRNPDTRDINYYKYSTLTEDEIKKQLLIGNEHKQLLLDGRDYKKAKERALQAETRVKLLEGQILDQIEEFKQLTNLLKEKNRHITEIREKLNTPKGASTFTPASFEAKQVLDTKDPSPTSSVHFTNTTQSVSPIVNKPLVARIRKILKDML